MLAKTPQTPKRRQVLIRVSVETKQRLERIADFYAKSSTSFIEQAADSWERKTLDRLPKNMRAAYLRGQVTIETAFPNAATKKKSKMTRERKEPGLPTVALSCPMLAEHAAQLRRYSKFYGLAMGDILERFFINFEKDVLKQLSPEDQKLFFAGKLDRLARALDKIAILPIEESA
jgi:predicted transcriptional regulator